MRRNKKRLSPMTTQPPHNPDLNEAEKTSLLFGK
jgi:hypothetical protein